MVKIVEFFHETYIRLQFHALAFMKHKNVICT